jgi:hypothetical protein
VTLSSHTGLLLPKYVMSKRKLTAVIRERSKKQATGSTTRHCAESNAPRKPNTPVSRKNAMFEESVMCKDGEVMFPTAMHWGKLMVNCFWQHFAKFDPLDDTDIIMRREEHSFTDGVLRFLKRNKGKCCGHAAYKKDVEKEVIAYRKARRQELDKYKREALRSTSAALAVESPAQPSVLENVQKGAMVMPPERSVLWEERNRFYTRAELELAKAKSISRDAVDNILNKLLCGEVVFSIKAPQSNNATMGSYRHDRHGPWAHSGAGSAWAEMFVPSLDRIAQHNIPVGGRMPLFYPEHHIPDGYEHMHMIKIGEGKYSQIFAPSNMLTTDKPVDLSGWPPMLVRVDSKGVRRSKNVAIRVPRLNRNDKATNDGSIAYAHEEAVNICEAAFAGFGPSLFAAFFLPDPDPPSTECPQYHSFRMFTIMKRQNASLEQRIRTSSLVTPTSFKLQTKLISKASELSDNKVRYLTMLFDAVFEYSARGIVHLDASRGNFMDEESVFRTKVNLEDVEKVENVNVIDLDPRFYRRLDGAAGESIWLFNIALVLAHMRRVDIKQQLMPLVLNMTLRGGMPLKDLLCKVYIEQQHNPRSAWLFSIPWNDMPPQWKPDLDSEWKTSIGSQMQQIVAYYFFYSERDGNGCNALSAFDRARCKFNARAVDMARSIFHNNYIAGGGMHSARHFLYAARDNSVTSLIYSLLLYVDAATLFKRPELLNNEPYVKPTPLPRMDEPLEAIDGHLGLIMRSSVKLS